MGATHRQSRASDILEPNLFSRPPDTSPEFSHCEGELCAESVLVDGTCRCHPCPQCDAMNAEMRARHKNEYARRQHVASQRPPASSPKPAPRRQGTTAPKTHAGYEPVHCTHRECLEPRTRVHSGAATWACACACGGCKSATQAYLAACCLEHCGGDRCIVRLKAGYQVPFPGCGCGCDACHQIAVAAGIRPPNYEPPVTDEQVARILAERAADHPQGANGSQPPPAPRPPPGVGVGREEAAAEGPDDELGGFDDPILEGDPWDDPVLEEMVDPVLEEETIDGGPGFGPVPPGATVATASSRVADLVIQYPCGGINLQCGVEGPCVHHPKKPTPPAAIASSPEVQWEPNLVTGPGKAGAYVVTHAAAAAAASPNHRLRLAVEAHAPSPPVVTGSKCSLLRECLYWTREDVERVREETSEDAHFGIVGHTFAEEYSRGSMTARREEEILEMVPRKDRDRLRACIGHVRTWVDKYRGRFLAGGVDGLVLRAELPVAWDPDHVSELGFGMVLDVELRALGAEGHRAYSDGALWASLRARLDLGPRTIPATLDLVRFEEGNVIVADWCFGRTNKRRQLALGALVLASHHDVDVVYAKGLHVDEEGLREQTLIFARDEAVAAEMREQFREPVYSLAAQAVEFRALLDAAPSSAPTPGTHCVHDYCPARFTCPVTQAAAAQLLDPETPGELVQFVLEDRTVERELRMSVTVQDRKHAEWMYPRWKLLQSLDGLLEKRLRAWIEEQPPNERYLVTAPGKCYTKTQAKGRERFDEKHAVRIMQALGATEEQILSCRREGPPGDRWIEKNLSKRLPEAS